MVFLDKFFFPPMDTQVSFLNNIKETCYGSVYPFGVFSLKNLTRMDFEPITILYGNNGSGKTTILNIISQKLNLKRDTIYNKSSFYDDYLDYCHFELSENLTQNSKIITSDDVFDYILNIRNINESIEYRREDLFEDYYELRKSGYTLNNLSDLEELKKVNKARKKTKSGFVKNEIGKELREYSNGESAFIYFQEHITENGLFLLDEPENSLSPKKRLEMVSFLEQSARYMDCQFIISTHCPFILSLKNAKIYDLDDDIVTVKKWYELSNVREYYNFFKKHSDEFEMW